jgi:hypothetical protein
MPGWIKLPRDIVKHAIWQKEEPFCWKAAFIDLMLLANFETHTFFFNDQGVTVKAGEIITSQEKLSARWNWNTPKVRRFLRKLKSVREIDYQTNPVMTRITLCNWGSYQEGVLSEKTIDLRGSVPQALERRSTGVVQASTYNNDKNEKNDKKESQVKNLKFVRAKKGYEELSQEEKTLSEESARLYEETLKSKIDFNKLCILVYGSEEDIEPKGFGDWQTLRKALGCLSKEELTHKVLHPYYYIWSLSRQKDYVEKMKQLTGSHSEEP